MSLSSGTPGICSVSGNTVSGLAAGACSISANQAGNASYNAAAQVTQSISIGKADQGIGALGALPALMLKGGTGTLSATSSSALAVSFSSATPGVCTVSGSTVTGVGPGSCVVAADQAGDANYNPALQVTRSTTVLAAATLAAGYRHSVALKPDGTVLFWGSNDYGQLGDGTTTTRVRPVAVPGLTGVVAVAAANFHTLALKSDGTVLAWGTNESGQLGDGTTTNRTSPVAVPGFTGVVALAGGAYHTVALKSDGTVLTWGFNATGQQGDGTTVTRLSPAAVPGVTGTVAVAAGSAHTLVLKSDGTVSAWGYNYFGGVGDGTTTNRLSPVAVPGLTGVVSGAVVAFFNRAPRSMIGGTGYDSLNLAYAAASSSAGASTTIMALDGDLLEILNANLGKYVILQGGYNEDYLGRSGMPTLLRGPLSIRSGKLTVDRVVIKKP